MRQHFYGFKIDRLKRLARRSSGVKPRHIQEMLNQISMSISTEHLPKSSIEMYWNFPFCLGIGLNI